MGIELCVDSVPLLRLWATFRLSWDEVSSSAEIAESAIVLRPAAPGQREPLLRYEDDRVAETSNLPGAHVQVHGHRDAPECAAATLRDLGYTIGDPIIGPPATDTTRLELS